MAKPNGRPARRAREPVSLARLAGRGVLVVAISLGVLFVTLAGTALLVAAKFAPDAARFDRATAAAGLAHSGMLDQETGLRGYLVSKDPTFLEAFSQGQRELAQGNLNLAAELGGDAQLISDTREVQQAQQRWVDSWALPALSGAPITLGGNLEDFLVRGKILFDDYRTDQVHLVATINRKQAEALGLQNTILEVTALFELLLVVALAGFGRRRSAQLRLAMDGALANLSAGLEGLVAGDYTTRVPGGTRVLEFAAISNEVDELAATLGSVSTAAAAREAENEAQSRRLRHLLEVTRDIAGSLSLPHILQSIGTGAARISPYDVVAVWLLDDTRERLIPTFVSNRPKGQTSGIEPLELGSSLPGLAAKYGQAFVRSGAGDPPAGYMPEVTTAALAVPMTVGGRCLGVIELALSAPGSVTGVDLPLIETLAIHAGSALEAARLHQESEEQAQVDGLTRLFNRRRLDDDLAQEVSRAIRYARPLSFIMLDTDHFKDLNDRLGHQVGDEVLAEVAALLKDGLRLTDTAYRYGGEEFALLLRETGAKEAVVVAERMRGRIEQRFSGPGNPTCVTASFGVAALGAGMERGDELIRSADQSLYAAKQGGRNRVVVASGDEMARALRPVV